MPVTAPALAEGRRASELGIVHTQEYELTGVMRWGEILNTDTPIEAGDVLVFAATEEGIAALWASPLFGMSAHRLYAVSISTGERGTLHELEEHGSIRIIAARTASYLHETEMVPGDICFVSGESGEAISANPSVALWQDAASTAPQPGKTWVALAVLAAVIVAASFGLLAAELASSGGAVLMVLTGVISPRSAARALDPKLLGILAGSIGLGTIVVDGGLADVISDAIRDVSGGNVVLVVVVLAITTAVLTNLVTNAATASILTPIGIGLATELALDPVIVLALIGTCVSFTFLNPFSHQSNVMIMRPGGYSTALFARVGVPLLLGVLITVCGVAYVLV
jgi:hypothetical protein